VPGESVFVDGEYIQKRLTPEEEMRLAAIEHHATRGEGIQARKRTLGLKALADERRRAKSNKRLAIEERVQGRGPIYGVEVAARDRRITKILEKQKEQDRLEGSTKYLKSVNDANRREKARERLDKEERVQGRGPSRLMRTLQGGDPKPTESEIRKQGAIMGGLFDMSKDLLLGDDARSGQMRDLFVVDPDAFYASLSKELEGLEPEERGFIAREELLRATDGRLDLEEFVSEVA
jgi:hypothetical protein